MTRQVSKLMTNAACKGSFSALKLVRTYLPTTTGYPSLHLMMVHVHRGLNWLFQPVCARNLCHWLMRHILMSKVVFGGFENVFFGVGLRLMSKKMFSSVTCDRTSQVKELVLQHEAIETMAQGSR